MLYINKTRNTKLYVDNRHVGHLPHIDLYCCRHFIQWNTRFSFDRRKFNSYQFGEVSGVGLRLDRFNSDVIICTLGTLASPYMFVWGDMHTSEETFDIVGKPTTGDSSNCRIDDVGLKCNIFPIAVHSESVVMR